jgi:hypothetical protein
MSAGWDTHEVPDGNYGVPWVSVDSVPTRRHNVSDGEHAVPGG